MNDLKMLDFSEIKKTEDLPSYLIRIKTPYNLVRKLAMGNYTKKQAVNIARAYYKNNHKN